MEKIFLVIICSLSAVTTSCVPENRTVNATDIQRNLLSFQYGSIDFALAMFRGLYNNTVNLFFSPLSVWVTLVSIYVGSRHETAKELETVLGIRGTDSTLLPETLSAFLEICNGCKEDNKSTVKIANRIYFQEDLELKLCGKELEKMFHKIDFKTNPEGARTTINDYIKNETNGKIQELVPPLSVSPLTQMIIANAVYFKGIWRNKFNKTMTRPLRFRPDRKTVMTVDMMNTGGTYIYGVSDQMDCQALEIPYEGGSISMLILLPKHSFLGLDILARTITPERLENLLNSMTSQDVLVTIPKFKVEQQYELSKDLQKLGLRSLFDPRFSDLSGFAGIRGLSVDAIHHKSYIKVNEEGTEAAGATSALLSRESHALGITRFYANRPFMYFIRDSYSDELLFMGTIRVPQYNEQNNISNTRKI